MPESFAGCQLESVGGVPVLWAVDDRFKTFRLVFCCQRPFDDRAAARALLPALLLHGTSVHADRPALARAMERLYGAWVGPGTGRYAETQVFRLAAEAVAGRFLPGRPDQLGAVLGLCGQFLAHPRLSDGGFPAPVFERERDHALAVARSLIDEKGAFARQQAIAAACAGEPYAVPEHGGVEAIAALTATAPEAARVDVLRHGRRWCVAMGAVPSDLPERLGELFAALPPPAAAAMPPVTQPARRAPRRCEDHAAMQQAKVVLVFRFPVPADARATAALQVFASLFGGGPHSRLFVHVRERQSLCYAIAAGGDVHKGVLLVQAGCDASAAAAVIGETLRQLAAVVAGEITDTEVATAIATIVGPFLAVDDSLAGRMQFTAEQWLLGRDQTPAQRIAGYRAVAAADVVEAARSVWLDLEYLLSPEAP